MNAGIASYLRGAGMALVSPQLTGSLAAGRGKECG